ncbi:sulfatase [Tamlana fucoidanivorans]|uniref:Sulfatase n=1 Tax=Allotamlana fucoidanivorans TaxID=2583814 RepID=A0A5C4SP33_9FLAO|nr:sulfatase [Tamlana fucoidanivorans]TNJ46038.1 sulfatase [Tamlana fucoidanivorans]
MKEFMSLPKLIMFLSLCAISTCVSGQHSIQTKPNILCLVIEDTSSYQFGCYGNKDINTPNIDALALKGIKYTNASSNAPHCSPARSTLITGCYATSFGMDIHREDYDTPENIFFPNYLRKAGYFCTNNVKTDYNTKLDNKSIWDECSTNATYNSINRKPNQPFFSVFNTTATHMGLVRTITIEGRPDFKEYGIDINKLNMPPHIPDLPEMRSDEAFQLKASQESDQWVNAYLNDLKLKGLDGNTIIFFFSDHGGCLPRGKGFPFESGLKIPLIVYIPPAWAKKLDIKTGYIETRNVGFVDFAPTFLSIAGVNIPDFMEGIPFLGKKVEESRKLQFGFRSNQENYHFDPSRTVSDGRFKYIKNYIPHKPFCLRNLYQWGMPANQAWDTYIISGICKNEDWLIPYKPKEDEMLFDLENDPWELNNLANNSNFKEKLKFLREEMAKHVRETHDLGFFPREMRTKKKNGLYKWVKDVKFPLELLYSSAELAGSASNEDIPELLRLLKSEYAVLRYWATVAFCHLGSTNKLKIAPKSLIKAIEDEDLEVATMASEAICYMDNFELGVDKLINLFRNNFNPAYSSLETLTWYPEQKKSLKKYSPIFRKIALGENKNEQGYQGLVLRARSIQVNLNDIPITDLFTEKEKKDGIKKNKTGRKFIYPN